MSSESQMPSAMTARRPAGPQGTRLFSTDDLRQYAVDAEPVSAGRASAREPVLEGVGVGVAGRRFVLRAGRQTIGRREDNDLAVDDPSVSSSHAWIVNQRGHCVIMNTLSTNGTFVNDQRIHETTLRHGDHVRLGQAEFVFLTREPGSVAGVRWRRVGAGLLALVAAGTLAWWLLG
jgi:hypothetical protein